MDYNNFIFNSDTIYEQLVESRNVSVGAIGNIGAGSTRTWTSEWFSMAEPGMTVRGKALVPGSTITPNVSDSVFKLPVEVRPNSTAFLVLRIEVSGTEYRAVVAGDNLVGASAYNPNRTIDFTIRVYSPPVM